MQNKVLASSIESFKDLNLSANSLKVLEKRYLLRDESGNVIESVPEMFKRISRTVGIIDLKYSKKADISATINKFYSMMSLFEFLPNSPTIMNAGTQIGQLSACFVIPIEDSLKSIFEAVKTMGLIHQSGGGTGFSFSNIRPYGDIVHSTNSLASGPVSFMQVFDETTNVVKQGGRRRGANIGILRVDHPDILEFITVKQNESMLQNFNLSVAVTDKFMQAVKKNSNYPLINPRTGEKCGELKAREVFNLIIKSAWQKGDPGIIFIDEINKHNPTPGVGRIEATNPCGEQPLLPYESCNLGSINLSKFVKNQKIDWARLKEAVHNSVHFLDNVIDANRYISPKIESITKANRKIGLGVMGFAEMLIKMNITYDSNKAVKTAKKIMKFISKESHKKSAEIGSKRGSFPNIRKSIWKNKKSFRNATTTTIAPTGTISIIAGCSSGIEPLFAIAFKRDVLDGTQLFEANPEFERIAKERKFYSKSLMTEIAKSGSVQRIKGIPPDVKRIFKTALDINYQWHIKMQAAFQKYTDNAVSKTINFPANAKVEDVKKAYLLAYKLKCKGITVYRYGSKTKQVLYIGSAIDKKLSKAPKYVSADAEYSGGKCHGNACQ